MVVLRRVCMVAGMVVGVVTAMVGVLLLVAAIRAATLQDIDYQESAIDPGPREDLPEWYLKGLPELMATALTIPTISRGKKDYNTEELLRFHTFLRDNFPGVFNSSFIIAEVVNTYSLLFTIQGNDTGLTPYLLMSHMDVVPVVEEKWTHDPFGGHILPDPITGEEYIWGRGAIDDKLGVMGIMMALNYLTLTDFQPSRPFYIAFGHDEEVMGADGAGHLAKVLEERGVKLDFILDEGMPILTEVVKGIDLPLAAVGVTEKGWMMVEIEVEGEGGHSSMPRPNSAVSRLAAAIFNLETHPQPSKFGQGPEADLFSYIAPKASWPHKLIFANMWLFKPIIEMVLSGSPDTNALIRTTTSTTIVRAGIKENVVPSSGYAIVNHRVHPAQSIESVLEYDRSVINDPTVKVTLLDKREPHPVSPYGPEVPAWRLLTTAIHHHFPGAIVAPGMMVGWTDTRYYLHLTPHVYRFNPVLLTKTLMFTKHGHDERAPATAITTAASFYHHLILSADQQTPPLKASPGHRSGEL